MRAARIRGGSRTVVTVGSGFVITCAEHKVGIHARLCPVSAYLWQLATFRLTIVELYRDQSVSVIAARAKWQETPDEGTIYAVHHENAP